MDDSIAGLRAFVALAESGGFNAAAKRLGLSRSAVSKAVTRLEQRLDRRLVERSSLSLGLTEEGRVLLHHGRRVLDELMAAQEAFDLSDGAVSGIVHLELPPLFGRQQVMPVLRRLSERYPQLRFDIGFSSQVSELVAEGVDLPVRIGTLADRAELVARPLGVQCTGLYASPDYLDRCGQPAAASELAHHQCLLNGLQDSWSWLPEPVALHGYFALRDTAALFDATLAGQGIALLPSWLTQASLAHGELQAVLPELSTPSLPIHAVWPRGRYLPARTRVVIDAWVDAFAR